MFVKKTLWPTIKKKKVVFFIMILVVFISALMSSSFSTTYYSFKKNAAIYLDKYGYPDITLVTSRFSKDKLDGISVDGVEELHPRTYSYKGLLVNGFPKLVRLNTYTNDSFLKFYTLEETNSSSSKVNVYVDFSFAKNNNIKVGSTINLYSSKDESSKVACFVKKIVGTTETIYPQIQYTLEGDIYNYGYVYMEQNDYIKTYVDNQYNEIIVKTKTGYDEKTVYVNLKQKLSEKDINVTIEVLKSESKLIESLNNNITYLKTAGIVIPLVLSIISIILMMLFLYQITKDLIFEMGVLNALGVKKGTLFRLIFAFSLSVSLIGGLLGSLSGFGFSQLIYSICKTSFIMPLGASSFNIYVTLVVLSIFAVVGLISSLFSIFTIRKLSPREVMNNNMTNNKELPKHLDNLTKKSIPLNLAVNSLHKNKISFIISFVAVTISFAGSFGAVCYKRSTDVYIEECVNRFNYDAQVCVINQEEEEKSGEVKKILEEQKKQGNVYTYENTYYGDMVLSFNGINIDSSLNAIEPNSSLVRIPGNLHVDNEGIIVESTYAKKAGIKVNDVVTVTVKDISCNLKVSAIANIAGSKCNYISCDTYTKNFKGQGYISYLVNYNSKLKFTLSLIEANSIPLYTEDLINSHVSGHRILTLAAMICAAIIIIISFLTIAIISRSLLDEQKRKLSILRVIGLKEKDVFKISFYEMMIYTILGLIPAIPLGVAFNKILNIVGSTYKTTLPFINPWWVFLLILAITIVSVTVNLIIQRITIKRWNISQNVKCRE